MQSLSGIAQGIKDTTLVIYFPSNQFRIDDNQLTALHQFSKTVTVVYSIDGFADTVGNSSSNNVLSEKRANAVYEVFLKDEVQLKSRPSFHGELNEYEKLGENRRVEIRGGMHERLLRNEGIIIKEFNLDQIYFVPDKTIITPESLSYIDILISKLKKYKNDSIEIIGHMNYQSNGDSSALHDLFLLSEQRAKTIYLILIDHGFNKENLSYKGVGNTQPVIPDPQSDEERKKNMRVQVIIRQ